MVEKKTNVPKKRSEKRKRSPMIGVRVTLEEKAIIQKKASQCSKKPGTYLRDLGLGKTIKSTVDAQAFLEISKLRADLGRVGGLVKAWLSPWEKEIGNNPVAKANLAENRPSLNQLLKNINGLISDIDNKIDDL